MKVKHRAARLLVSVAAAGAVIAITSAPAWAGQGGTQGPGTCGAPPGVTAIAPSAKIPGSNGGPNAIPPWTVNPGAPNAPGQAVQFFCQPGH